MDYVVHPLVLTRLQFVELNVQGPEHLSRRNLWGTFPRLKVRDYYPTTTYKNDTELFSSFEQDLPWSGIVSILVKSNMV